MNCFRCNKEGAIPYKYKVEGRVETVYLCGDCYAELSRGGQVRSQTADRAGDEASRQGGLLGMERRCPACGTKLSSIRKTGYIGCAECFSYFRNELIPVMDKFQSNIISNPEKKRREMEIILLEDEYIRLSSKKAASLPERNAVAARLGEIELRLADLGVRVDD